MEKNNITELRKRLGITQKDIAKKLNLSQAQICLFEKGEKTPTVPQKQMIADLLGVDINDLYGDTIYNITYKDSNTVSIDIISATPCCGLGLDSDYADEIVGKWVIPIKDFKDITYSKPQDIKQMRVIGDSMEPTIKDGDFILVDTSYNHFDIDGIYLIRMAAGLAVKRLQMRLNDIQINSDNEKYKPITAEVGEVITIGKVIKILNMKNV